MDQYLLGDCVARMRELPEASVDLVFADPPYNLQLGAGLKRPGGGSVAGVDADWDRFDSHAAYDDFTRAWLSAARRVLRPDGTLWVIGSFHNIYQVGYQLQALGFWLLGDVHWAKTNPMPNFRGKRFQNATETMIWAQPNKGRPYTFNYHALKSLNDDRQMRNWWELPIVQGTDRLKDGEGNKLHPTQKPEALLYRVLLASSNPGDTVLDPFFGTGTTGAVAHRLGRRFVGIERDPGYLTAARKRIEAIAPGELPDSLVQVRPPRADRRIAMATLVEEGWIAPGQEVRSRCGRFVAQVRADGKLVSAGSAGSIHALGAQLQGRESCNGWDFWRVERDGSWAPLDTLRAMRASAAESTMTEEMSRHETPD
ncbi:site-specific DNA-methyltransferase [Rhodovibrio sodomensis]|nr:site-specific DNA-methyltransferase [Rhodovibrio sodomensis]